jgi:outer membrane receptor protein involved in Fe transport
MTTKTAAMKRACLLLAGASLLLAPGMAFAQQEDASGIGQDIVVYARKRAENVQDVPMSITAVTAAEAERKGIVTALDLVSVTPNLTTNSAFGETQPNYALRGISVANEFNPNQASPIGVYVDEAYMSNRISHGLQLLDVDRIEVLRGPQGTLYGRNTTGGAISVYTRKPTLEGGFSGYAEAGIGNADRVEGKAALDSTLDEAGIWGLRIAGSYVRADGLIRNRLPGKADLNSIDTLNGRATLRFRPDTEFDATLAIYAGRNRPTSSAAFAIGTGAGGVNPLTGYTRAGLGFYEAEMDGTGRFRTWGKGALLRMQWKAGDAVQITSVTSLDDGGQDLDFDADGSPFDILTDKWKARFRQINQELRAEIDLAPGLSTTLGGYYGADEVHIEYRNDFLHALPSAFTTTVDSVQKRASYAGFANIDWNVTDRLNISAGLRWTHDTIQVVDDTATYRGVTTIGPGYSTPRRKSSAVTGRVSVDYEVADAVRIYASFSRGYRGGGYNASTSSGLASLTYVEPEFVRTYEAGIKSEFANRMVTLNLSAFHNGYRNQQLQELVGAVSYLRNAGRSTLRGAEAELTLRPVASLTLSGSIGYLDATYDRLTLSGFVLDGNRLPFAPEWTANANANWRFARLGGFDISANATIVYTDFQYFSPFNETNGNGTLSQDANIITNGQLRIDDGDRYLSLWVRNLFEKKVYVYGLDVRSLGYNYLVQNNPRTFGLRAGLRF